MVIIFWAHLTPPKFKFGTISKEMLLLLRPASTDEIGWIRTNVIQNLSTGESYPHLGGRVSSFHAIRPSQEAAAGSGRANETLPFWLLKLLLTHQTHPPIEGVNNVIRFRWSPQTRWRVCACWPQLSRWKVRCGDRNRQPKCPPTSMDEDKLHIWQIGATLR
jgi:hypothetical protein